MVRAQESWACGCEPCGCPREETLRCPAAAPTEDPTCAKEWVLECPDDKSATCQASKCPDSDVDCEQVLKCPPS